MAKASNDVAIPQANYDNDTLRTVDSFDAAMQLVTETLGAPADASQELGNGFAICENKDVLIGQAIILISWSFSMGDFGEFVSANVVTQAGAKWVVNDGSSGIYKQLREYTDRTGRNGGMLVKRGLRKSEYSNDFTEHGVTHYLDTSA